MKQMKIDKEKSDASIPIDYSTCSIKLTKEDFQLNIQPKIAPHLKEGSYGSWEKYFNTLFYLEKEDCYKSLRTSIHRIMNNHIDLRTIEKENRDLYYYKKVEIVSIDITYNGIFITLDFELISQHITFTKRMIFGSLLILTDTEFSEFIFTIVHENPYLRRKLNTNFKNAIVKELPRQAGRFRIAVSLVTISEESFNLLLKNRNKDLQIFESKAYFESYVHIMKRLQTIRTQDLPFEDIIIKGDFKSMTPKYLNDLPLLTYGSNESIDLRNHQYPASLKRELDDSQFNALKMALENKIAVIQGPPGTGKTHVGALIAKILIENTHNGSPLLIVCFTNHALDQFLEHILSYTTSLIRIGGRCNNEKLLNYNLNYKQRPRRTRAYYTLRDQIEIIAGKMIQLTETINKRKNLNAFKVKKHFTQFYTKLESDFIKKTQIKITKENSDEQLYLYWIEEDTFDEMYYFYFKDDKYYNHYFKQFDSFYSQATTIAYLPQLHLIRNNNDANQHAQNSINLPQQIPQIQPEELIDDDDEEEIGTNLDRMANNYDEDDFDLSHSSDDKKIHQSDYEIKGANDLTGTDIVNYTQAQFEFIINNYNLWNIGKDVRKNLMKYMKNKMIDFISIDLSLLKKYDDLFKKKKLIELMADCEVIRQYKVVGMTTTGASKYATILEQIKFEKVIVEEAAEVLESHISTLLTQNTKHLIMIGDHKQLRPKPYNYEIASKFNFDISMFERLINNKIPFASLKYQRRMKPIFADFVRIIYQTGYDDHITTTKKDFAKGFISDMHIFSHTFPEKEDIGLASKSNDFEARYLIKLAQYILQQNYTESQVTILTFYVGQVLLLRKYAREANIKPKIISVDNYQGEENDFILLSLVRSNKKNSIGFLKTFNRVCVAFSRAKIGFYIAGNIDCLIAGEVEIGRKDNQMKEVWKQIKQLAEQKKIIDNKITLACQKHKNQTIIESIADFAKIPEGGCKERCREKMKCGHVCELACHSYSHDVIKCYKPCEIVFDVCQHKCTKRCYEQCDKCLVRVDKILDCNHRTTCYCYNDIKDIQCHAKCEKILSCNHQCKRECYEKFNEHLCYELVLKKLPCGHQGEYYCHLPIEKCICPKKCSKLLPCGHICEGTCGKCLSNTLHIPCRVKCDKPLICGHICKKQCSQPCLCNEDCVIICSHSHCASKCCEICVNCVEQCENKCNHYQCHKKCWEQCDTPRCNTRCQLILSCGHQCIGLCGQTCPSVCRTCNPNDASFEVMLGHEDEEDGIYYQLSKCGHIFEIRDLDYYIDERKAINMLSCPKCKTLIVYEKRYLNSIKQIMKDIQNVKKIYLERTGSEQIKEDSTKQINKILELISNQNFLGYRTPLSLDNNNLPGYFETVRITYELCKAFLSCDDRKAFLITTFNLITLLEKFIVIESFVNKAQKTQKNLTEFLINYNQVQNYFLSFKEFNQDFFQQLQLKINTMHLFCSTINDDIRKMIVDDNFSSKRAIDKSTDFYILYKNEYIEILKGMGSQWYKCPQGHIYVVGECGRPTQVAVCPECHQNIGGQNHIPVRGNETVNNFL